MKKAFITGATGTLGREVLRQLGPDVEILCYSKDEFRQSQLPKTPNIVPILGCVRDLHRIIDQTRNVDVIFHFAALKRVDSIEENPEEAVLTNVIGTMNIMSAQRANKVPRVVLSATDKGVMPINAYGATKLLSERVVLRNKNNIVCRYGNVLGSRGSVVPAFVESISKHNCVNVTDLEMTRFFIRIEDAARFVIESSQSPAGGLFVPKMKAATVVALAHAIGEVMGKINFEIKETGARAGEKHHEVLHNFGEDSSRVEQFSHAELVELVRPSVLEAMLAF